MFVDTKTLIKEIHALAHADSSLDDHWTEIQNLCAHHGLIPNRADSDIVLALLPDDMRADSRFALSLDGPEGFVPLSLIRLNEGWMLGTGVKWIVFVDDGDNLKVCLGGGRWEKV